ncbi:MAG: UDP-glucose 4-epimerase family protein [Gammaproteobacteria bacterium]
MTTVLVTGATGFVGTEVCRLLLEHGRQVRAALRSPRELPAGMDPILVGNIGPDTVWSPALTGVDAVVHLAARVQVMPGTARDPLVEFRRVNTAGTERLAAEAAKAGVRRLVYISTVKVNGEATAGRAFTEDDGPAPEDPYGVSKHEAELALQRVAAGTGIEVVVVRPPLVYGAGVGGNLYRILRAIHAGLPLPFGAVDNRRSLVGVSNLADLIRVCLEHPAAAGQTFLVSDGRDLATSELVHLLADGLGRPVRLWSVPMPLFRVLGACLGRRAEVERLCGSLQVSAEKAWRVLGWQAPVPIEEGLRRTAEWFARSAGR